VLARNTHYWKRDSAGRQLPYLDAIRLDVQQNRETELLRFERGEIQLINALDPEYFDRLAAKGSNQVVDAGPGTDAEFLWFNQAGSAPISPYKLAWFRTTEFRRAISEALNREDICRLVYRGHARPAAGPVSTANHFWYNSALKPASYDIDAARRLLQSAGFRYTGGVLRDSEGHPVEFTILTNAGNKPRERMAALIQEDLSKLGIKITIAALDFPSVLERISRTNNYDACLLGLVDVGLDPNAQMNVWLSSSEMHSWNPKEAKPETAWEAEIDKLMRQQASALDPKKRKAAFDKVQQIVREQAPIIYLVNKNALAAVNPAVKNAQPVALRPQTYWNAERLVL
jgi:peptide/nickel transport system substrate-binding protein